MALDTHPVGVEQQSPGSRSAPWVEMRSHPAQIPPGFYRRAQVMPQSLVQLYVHIVFSTKHRQPFFTDDDFRTRIHRYLAGIYKNLDCPAIIVGGIADHVHILCRLARTINLANLIRDSKRDSSKWIKVEQPKLKEFHWQQGYGAFSISPSHIDGLEHYIANQDEHHRHETFQDEFRRLCRKFGLALDERYAWD